MRSLPETHRPAGESAPVRVAIIGGGASGWAAAEALEAAHWAGAFEVTVFERNGYFGGKCHTVFPDGTPCNGAPGGYELGAGVLSKGSHSNADLEALLVRHGIGYSNAAEPHRDKYRFYSRGKPLDARAWLRLLLLRPFSFLVGLLDFARFRFGLFRHSRHPTLDYAGRPKALHASFHSVHTETLNRAVCFGMQGFGYADTSDPGLTPPLLYYHQYARPDVLWNPVYRIDAGMQGIWARLAERRPKERARLHAEVLRVRRSEDGVVVETAETRETFDRLIIAAPLAPELPFLDAEDIERDLLAKVRCNHYITVLCRVRGLTDIAHVVVDQAVDPARLGGVVFAYKRYPDSDWVTLNLYADPARERTDEEILDVVERDLQREMDASLVDRASASVHHFRDYFPHLGTADLDAGWYSHFEEHVQGQRRTLWVSSGLHMETVGASVQYATAKVNAYAPRWLAERAQEAALRMRAQLNE